jgi:hypothetical protein
VHDEGAGRTGQSRPARRLARSHHVTVPCEEPGDRSGELTWVPAAFELLLAGAIALPGDRGASPYPAAVIT